LFFPVTHHTPASHALRATFLRVVGDPRSLAALRADAEKLLYAAFTLYIRLSDKRHRLARRQKKQMFH